MVVIINYLLPPELHHLKDDPEIKRKVVSGYNQQVGSHNENGFTVRLAGLRVHFEIDQKHTGYFRVKGGKEKAYYVTYTGDVTDDLDADQTRQLEQNLERIFENVVVKGEKNFEKSKEIQAEA